MFWVSKIHERLSAIWIQPFVWTFIYLICYHLFFTAYMANVMCSSQWFSDLTMHISFLTIWMLNISALTKLLFTRPPTISSAYHVPSDILDFLPTTDVDDSDEEETSGFLGGGDSNDEKKWKLFYRKLWNVVNELQLDIRTVTINFRNQKFTLPKFCLHCKIVKPKRTYHCSRCEKCVRRMCHHCLALGKCVHLANHKFFLLFLAYVVLMCWFSFTTTVNALYCTVVDYQQTPKPKSILFVGPLTFSLMGCAQSLIFPFVMIYFQWDFWDDLLKNQTKVEDLENELKESFDTGSRLENFETIFGKQRSLWFLPLQTTKLEMK